MLARSGLLRVPPDGVDAAVQSIHDDVIPRYRDLAGYRGFTILVDRERGEVLGISYWETEEDMLASEGAGEAARRIASDAGGHFDSGVRQAWEIAGEDRP